jgi:hypothetical protein
MSNRTISLPEAVPADNTPAGWLDIVQTIELGLQRGYTPAELLDENSPIRDRMRNACEQSIAAVAPAEPVHQPSEPTREDVQFLIDLAAKDRVSAFERRSLVRIARCLAQSAPVHQPQPVATKDEPVAWRWFDHVIGRWVYRDDPHPADSIQCEPLYAYHPHREDEGEATDAGVQPSADAERIAELEEEVTHVRRWYGDRLEILSAWARESLRGEQLDTFFNIVANASPHVTDRPGWFLAVVKKLAEKRALGVPEVGTDADIFLGQQCCDGFVKKGLRCKRCGAMAGDGVLASSNDRQEKAR